MRYNQTADVVVTILGGKGRRNERGDRGQDRFRGERNGETSST